MKIEKDGSTGHRVQVMLTPILDDNGKDALGVIYIVASMEDVYKQMKDINQIFATGTVIALLVTAYLGFYWLKQLQDQFQICGDKQSKWQKEIIREK